MRVVEGVCPKRPVTARVRGLCRHDEVREGTRELGFVGMTWDIGKIYREERFWLLPHSQIVGGKARRKWKVCATMSR